MGADLATTYLGMRLASPIVASASPLTGDAATVRDLVHAGAAAVVMPSLFEEEILQDEIELNRALEAGTEHFAEALDYFPAVPVMATTGDRYLSSLAEIKAAVDVPVVASLNATSPGGWVRTHRSSRKPAPTPSNSTSTESRRHAERTAADVEDEQLAILADVREAITVPLAVKLSPYYSSMANFACRVVECGADGLVLFNRFYQPDIDLEALDVVPQLELSSPWELRLPMRWIAILRPLLPTTSLAATSGVASGTDAAKAIAVGADVAMMTSAVLRHGPDQIAAAIVGLERWLNEHEYESVDQLRGSMSHATSADPGAFERANYVRVLHSWSAPHDFVP